MKGRLSVLPLLLVLLLLTACSPGAASAKDHKPITVKVTANEFSFQSSLTTFQVGQAYRFEVTNKGNVPHEFMIVQPVKPGSMDMEALDEMALADISEEDLPPKATKSADYTFVEADKSGKLELACYVPGHYKAGMKLAITVK